MEEILSSLENGSLVVDLGSGAGSFNYNEYPSLRIISIDVERMRPKDGNFIRASVEFIPIRTSSAHFVVTNWILEHVKTVEICIGEISRICYPNAHWYVAIPNSSSLEDRLCRIIDVISSVLIKAVFWPKRKTKLAKGHVQFFTFSRMLRLAYLRGFRLIAFCDWGAGYTYLRNFDRIQRTTLVLIKFLGKITRMNFFEKSNYLFNFQKIDETVGYANYPSICRKCGAKNPLEASRWICQRCGTLNTR